MAATTRDKVANVSIARIAARQHGVISRSQLVDVGVSRYVIEHWLRKGWLHRLYQGVYAVGYRSSAPLSRAMAAVLACGPDAALSHRSAAALWEIGVTWRGAIEVTTTRAGRRHPGVTVHRSRTLTPAQVTVHRGIRVTTVERTLIDLADVLDDRALARAFNEAQIARRLRVDELAAQLAHLSGRRAASRLLPLVERSDGVTRSLLEDTFLALLDQHALPRPEVNQRVAGFEVDMLWREQRLVAELDGRCYHDHARLRARPRQGRDARRRRLPRRSRDVAASRQRARTRGRALAHAAGDGVDEPPLPRLVRRLAASRAVSASAVVSAGRAR